MAELSLQVLRELSPFKLPKAVEVMVEVMYTSAERAYHNLQHLEEMARSFSEVQRDVGWARPKDVFAALLVHDAVYDPGASDNEARSAELAMRLFAEVEGVDEVIVASLVRLTARHGRLQPQDVEDSDSQLFLDCDMAILAGSTERFLEYDAAIAKEYARLSPDIYAAGRRAFIERLARPEHRVFLSSYFHDRLESRAKANLRALLRTRPMTPVQLLGAKRRGIDGLFIAPDHSKKFGKVEVPMAADGDLPEVVTWQGRAFLRVNYLPSLVAEKPTYQEMTWAHAVPVEP